MSSLNIRVDPHTGVTRVRLEGDITETSDLSPLLGQAGPELVFDLEGVRRINSCGVREWVNLVTTLSRQGKAFALERCSVSVVNQLNMISNFRGSGQVRSFFAPYFCETCDAEHPRLLEPTQDVAARLEKEEVACPTCGKPMQFDDLPESYLAFIG